MAQVAAVVVSFAEVHPSTPALGELTPGLVAFLVTLLITG